MLSPPAFRSSANLLPACLSRAIVNGGYNGLSGTAILGGNIYVKGGALRADSEGKRGRIGDRRFRNAHRNHSGSCPDWSLSWPKVVTLKPVSAGTTSTAKKHSPFFGYWV